MDKHIIKVFNLESNPNDITPIDTFKLFRNFDAFTEALRAYASEHQLTDVEQFYFEIQTDPRRQFFYRLSQTYFQITFLQFTFFYPIQY